jgi:DNA-binding transcriptional LysR family regulator
VQLRHLSYFVAVAEERSFTRAADLLGVSQPTLSKQVRALENALGTSLLVRDRAGIELTSAGEALLPHAQRILIEADNAIRSVHEVASLRRGRVRMGATPSMIEGLLAPVLTRFRAEHPQIDLELHEAGSRDLTAELSSGRIDLALLIVPLAARIPELETSVVYTERLVLASPAGADMPDRMDVADLVDLPLVMFREGYDLRDVTLRACQAAGFEPRLAVEGGEMGSVLRFVESGLGHAVVPDIVMGTRTGLRRTQLENPPLSRSIAVAHGPLETLPLAARAFRSLLVETLQG